MYGVTIFNNILYLTFDLWRSGRPKSNIYWSCYRNNTYCSPNLTYIQATCNRDEQPRDCLRCSMYTLANLYNLWFTHPTDCGLTIKNNLFFPHTFFISKQEWRVKQALAVTRVSVNNRREVIIHLYVYPTFKKTSMLLVSVYVVRIPIVCWTWTNICHYTFFE